METISNEPFAIMNHLANKPNDITSADIPDPLSGIIDLSVFERNGYKNIHEAKFQAGNITDFINIPKSVTSIVCSNNLLTQVQIPDHLLELDVENNQISEIQSHRKSLLKVLNISGNNLSEDKITFSHFPFLTHLYLNNNSFEKLDLSVFEHLEVLECIGNDNIQLTNVQPYTRIVMDDTSTVDINEKEIDDSANEYDDAILQFFQKQFKYNNLVKSQLKKYKKKLASEKLSQTELAEKLEEFKNTELKCIQCKKKGKGTIFSQLKGTYSAKCGATKPCKLNILLKNNAHDLSSIQMIDMYRKKNDMLSQAVLQTKCKAIYSLQKTKDITKSFDELLNEYAQTLDIYKTTKSIYQEGLPTISSIHEHTHELNQQIAELKAQLKDYSLMTEGERVEAIQRALSQRERVVETNHLLRNLISNCCS